MDCSDNDMILFLLDTSKKWLNFSKLERNNKNRSIYIEYSASHLNIAKKIYEKKNKCKTNDCYNKIQEQSIHSVYLDEEKLHDFFIDSEIQSLQEEIDNVRTTIVRIEGIENRYIDFFYIDTLLKQN